MPRASASKKTALASEQDRPDVARKREKWKAHQAGIDPGRLVFIDETWAKTNMAPLRGWAARGKRLIGKAPFGHWNTMTFVAALRHDGIVAPWVIDGPINGGIFQTYVEQVLVPVLRPDDIVILDNLGSHKAPAIRKAIRAAGARLVFLPAYSPDPCGAKNSPPDCFLNAPHPSRRSLPSSNTCSVRPPSAARKPSGEESAHS